MEARPKPKLGLLFVGGKALRHGDVNENSPLGGLRRVHAYMYMFMFMRSWKNANIIVIHKKGDVKGRRLQVIYYGNREYNQRNFRLQSP